MGREGERMRGKETPLGETSAGRLLQAPNGGPGLQPRHVS